MQTVDQMVDAIIGMEGGHENQLLAPCTGAGKGVHKLIEDARKSGYVRLRVDGEVRDISEDIILEKNKKHTIEIVVDRLVIRPDIIKRLADSIETALNLSGGILVVNVLGGQELLFSQNFACSDCGISIEELAPRMFSFNNPHGACPECGGLGTLMKIDPILSCRSHKVIRGRCYQGKWMEL